MLENSCQDLITNLQNCSKYECSYFTDTNDYIKYKILGKDDKTLCRYVEQYNNDIMTCDYSHFGIQAKLKQLSDDQISSINIDTLQSIQAKECFFFSQEFSKAKASYELLEKTSKDYRKLKSIFFDEETISSLDRVISQFDKKAVYGDSLFSSDIIRLNSILYLSPNTWKIWINGKLFYQNSRNLHVLRVTPDFVQFMLLKNKGVPGITFTLYHNQTLNINDLYNEE